MQDDDSSDYSSEDVASKLKLLERGKKRTLEVLGEDEDKPKVFTLDGKLSLFQFW